jgi:hypothetical protein
MAKPEWTDHEEASLRHAWEWFALHAAQRLQMYNFFSVTTAFLLAAFVTAHGDGAHRLAVGVAAAAAASSIAFNLLEQRTRALVHAAEVPLRALEERLATVTGIAGVAIVDQVERPGHRFTKYSFVFNVIQRAAAASWILAALVEWVRFT